MARAPVVASGGRCLAGWDRGDVGEESGEPAEALARRWWQVREAEEAEGGSEEELVFGDVDVLVVVADFERYGDSESRAKLVGFAEPAPQDWERFFSLVVALQDAVGERPAGGVEE